MRGDGCFAHRCKWVSLKPKAFDDRYKSVLCGVVSDRLPHHPSPFASRRDPDDVESSHAIVATVCRRSLATCAYPGAGGGCGRRLLLHLAGRTVDGQRWGSGPGPRPGESARAAWPTSPGCAPQAGSFFLNFVWLLRSREMYHSYLPPLDLSAPTPGGGKCSP